MRIRIKVCCIASREEAQIAVDAGADALGLVAKMPSGPGPISDEEIADITAIVPPPVATFMLTSRTTADAISQHLDRTRPTSVQIVSHIDETEAARLARLQPHVRRVQVIHVEDRSALDLIPVYAPHMHAFLLDSGRPGADTPELGGTGRRHDWSISRAFVEASPLPVFLAGGLTADNARQAVREVRPFGLDLCTGVRSNDRLDEAKLKAFMTAATTA
ncbi:phosphoribosylanthranilate isomerase [Anderseniella sp. Alg231-50]|uniref:phosphoribosylanthranilate isomerase n=1 Tax=Anderseniella sp. Alg231-50 TaxID=1922226 RepID=UPI000D54BD71